VCVCVCVRMCVCEQLHHHHHVYYELNNQTATEQLARAVIHECGHESVNQSINQSIWVLLTCYQKLTNSQFKPTHVTNKKIMEIEKTKTNKKDGYRQQNVRQRQKLISIIDCDVCMTFY